MHRWINSKSIAIKCAADTKDSHLNSPVLVLARYNSIMIFKYKSRCATQVILIHVLY